MKLLNIQHDGLLVESAHVQSITIINSKGDNYCVTDAVKAVSSGETGKIIMTNHPEAHGEHDLRMRGELGVIIEVASEDRDTPNARFVIGHHKGSIYCQLLGE